VTLRQYPKSGHHTVTIEKEKWRWDISWEWASHCHNCKGKV